MSNEVRAVVHMPSAPHLTKGLSSWHGQLPTFVWEDRDGLDLAHVASVWFQLEGDMRLKYPGSEVWLAVRVHSLYTLWGWYPPASRVDGAAEFDGVRSLWFEVAS